MKRFFFFLCSSNDRRYAKVYEISEGVSWEDVSVPDNTIIYFFMHSEGERKSIEDSFMTVRLFHLESCGFYLNERLAYSTKVDNDTVYVVGKPYKDGCITVDGFIHFDDGESKLSGYKVVFDNN